MQEIDNALSATRVAILLVSANFFNSEFIQDNELPYLLEMQQNGKVRIIWVALSTVLYEGTPLENFQCANNPRIPIDALTEPEQNAEWVSICKQILAELKINN